MRYFILNSTLFVRGSFRAASTGISGGIGTVSTLINHAVTHEWHAKEPQKELELTAARAGLGRNFFGLITEVPMQNLCVLQYDFLTVFITAGITSGVYPEHQAGTINIIICSGQGMRDATLLETIMTATGAKADALINLGKGITGTPADGVIAACEGETEHEFAGTFTEIGRRVYASVLHGVPQALSRYEGSVRRDHPSFFIFSRFGGDHWVEWTPENCPYYPCHFPGQRCDYCYCPLYPCGDESLGLWVDSSNGGRVWNCARCTLLHEPAVADYLKQHPDATREELIRVRDTIKKG
jgi:adenosylcobinamide hydrolase